MASIRKHGKVWYYRFTDADGVKRERKGCPDRRETERLAVEAEAEVARIKAGLADPKALGYRRHEARPLADHLADWRRDMLARGKTAKHTDLYCERAGKLAAMVKGVALGDLQPGRRREARERAAKALADGLRSARLSDLAPDRIQAALGRLRDADKSHQTINHYRAALRAFARWAADNDRLRENPMRGVRGFNVEEDRRHERRSLTDAELARLIRAAGDGPASWGMPGPLRAMAYRLAAATGLRAEELRNLTPESFRLAGPEPTVTLKAKSAKNRRAVDQPIPAALARDLAAWLEGKPAGKPVLPLHHDTAKAIRGDLEAAGIAYETDEGVADFHSLRAYSVSALVRSGASIKEVQALDRHAADDAQPLCQGERPRPPGGGRVAPRAGPRRVGPRLAGGHRDDPRGPEAFPPFSHSEGRAWSRTVGRWRGEARQAAHGGPTGRVTSCCCRRVWSGPVGY